jgi:hypothetical protein
MMKAYEVTAITDFILAGEAFLAAGILLGGMSIGASAAFFWALAMLFFALGSLGGGIDHGFFEPKGDTRGRMIMQKSTWIGIGLMTFFTLLTAGYQFGGETLRVPVILLGIVQLAVFVVFALRTKNYAVVVVNYAPILFILLAANILGLASGSGSWHLVAGLLISIAASAALALDVNRFTPLDRNGVYHVLLMVAVVFFFFGGLALNG